MQCDNFLTGYGIQNEGGMHGVNIYEEKSFSVDNLFEGGNISLLLTKYSHNRLALFNCAKI